MDDPQRVSYLDNCLTEDVHHMSLICPSSNKWHFRGNLSIVCNYDYPFCTCFVYTVYNVTNWLAVLMLVRSASQYYQQL